MNRNLTSFIMVNIFVLNQFLRETTPSLFQVATQNYYNFETRI